MAYSEFLRCISRPRDQHTMQILQVCPQTARHLESIPSTPASEGGRFCRNIRFRQFVVSTEIHDTGIVSSSIMRSDVLCATVTMGLKVPILDLSWLDTGHVSLVSQVALSLFSTFETNALVYVSLKSIGILPVLRPKKLTCLFGC